MPDGAGLGETRGVCLQGVPMGLRPLRAQLLPQNTSSPPAWHSATWLAVARLPWSSGSHYEMQMQPSTSRVLPQHPSTTKSEFLDTQLGTSREPKGVTLMMPESGDHWLQEHLGLGEEEHREWRLRDSRGPGVQLPPWFYPAWKAWALQEVVAVGCRGSSSSPGPWHLLPQEWGFWAALRSLLPLPGVKWDLWCPANDPAELLMVGESVLGCRAQQTL